jgi:hypothetical protein
MTRSPISPCAESQTSYVCLHQLFRWDSCNWVKLPHWASMTISPRRGPMKLLCLEPLDTLISCKLESEAGGSNDKGSNIHEDIAIDSLS